MKQYQQFMHVILLTVKKHAGITLLLLTSILLTLITSLLPPLVLEKVVNLLAEKKEIALSLILSYFGLLVIAGIFEAVREASITIFGEKILHAVRTAMSQKISRLEASYFIEHDGGKIAALFVQDVDTIETLFTEGVISMFADACTLISIIIVVFTRSTGLGILLCITTPFLFLFTRFTQKEMLKSQKENREAVSRAAEIIPETLKNKQTIHNLDGEDFMFRRYDSFILRSYQSLEKSNFYDSIYSPIMIVISTCIIAIMMSLSSLGGVYQMFFGMSVGTAAALISYVNQVFTPLENIGMEIQNIQSAIAGISRINAFLNEKEKEETYEDIDLDRVNAIEMKDLSFGYSETKDIICHFDLSVRQKESVTVTGRTGAGKSTLFKLILGLYRPKVGSVKIYGADAAKIKEEEKREIYGCVEQEFKPTIGSIKDQITLKDPSVTDGAIKDALKITGLESVIDVLPEGVNTLFDPSLFSQGQLQLLSIARAIVKDPKILLLDEMSANLDAITEEEIMSALRKASQNKTVVSISHRTYAIKDGREISLG